jgi:RNA polymerase sigma-70 factor, ECF subfamily
VKQSIQANSDAQADEMSESDAIRLAQSGDPAGFEHLYRLHRRRVFSLCLRMVNNQTEAEDLTQDAFLQSFRKIQTFRRESEFSTWLHRLTVNVVLMRFRKKTLVQRSIDEMTEHDEQSDRPRREFGHHDLRLSGLVDRIGLQRALDQLPQGYKAMFILHDVEGYEHTEIAELMGCSVGNSKSQLHKARLRMRKLLQRPSRGPERREPDASTKLLVRRRLACAKA